jgi:hypothetical protein
MIIGNNGEHPEIWEHYKEIKLNIIEYYIFKYFIISANEVIGTFFTSFTKTPFSGDSRNYSLHF